MSAPTYEADFHVVLFADSLEEAQETLRPLLEHVFADPNVLEVSSEQAPRYVPVSGRKDAA